MTISSEGPINFFSDVATKLKTLWVKNVYHFSHFGSGVSLHYSCDIPVAKSKFISLEEGVFLAQEVWLNVVSGEHEPARTKMRLGKGCRIGRRSTISAKNLIDIGDDVLLAPSVLIMDHNHEYTDPNVPILAQGVTQGGQIIIEKNCWLGYGCVVFCGRGELRIGRNSIVGANSVLTRSVPPFSVVAGNPAKVIRRYDPHQNKWIKLEEGTTNAD